MVRADQTELRRDGLAQDRPGEPPAGVVDRLLWQDAQHLLNHHRGPHADGDCVGCGRRWPCSPRRLAEQAEAASRRPWRVAWTLRHDLNSMRAGFAVRPRRWTNQRTAVRAGTNRGSFD